MIHHNDVKAKFLYLEVGLGTVDRIEKNSPSDRMGEFPNQLLSGEYYVVKISNRPVSRISSCRGSRRFALVRLFEGRPEEAEIGCACTSPIMGHVAQA
jgi:hypothetical protein